jgi:hypothetical protein
MKNVTRSLSIITLLFAFTAGILFAGDGKGVSSSGTLSVQEEAGLLQMREEEKLARDVYRYLNESWSLRIFENIAASEQEHMDAIKNLLDKYSLEDPARPDEGAFSDSDIKALYDFLINEGTHSKVAALRVGATIEDMDIYDLQKLVDETDNADITRVYLNLMKGSKNHLRAFVGALEILGESYEASSYLTQEQIDAILDSGWETGPF